MLHEVLRCNTWHPPSSLKTPFHESRLQRLQDHTPSFDKSWKFLVINRWLHPHPPPRPPKMEKRTLCVPQIQFSIVKPLKLMPHVIVLGVVFSKTLCWFVLRNDPLYIRGSSIKVTGHLSLSHRSLRQFLWPCVCVSMSNGFRKSSVFCSSLLLCWNVGRCAMHDGETAYHRISLEKVESQLNS